MPRELQFTNAAREWLRAMDRAMREPTPTVSVEQYCAAIDSAEFLSRENFRLRMQYRRLNELARKLQHTRGVVLAVAVALAIISMALVAMVGHLWHEGMRF